MKTSMAIIDILHHGSDDDCFDVRQKTTRRYTRGNAALFVCVCSRSSVLVHFTKQYPSFPTLYLCSFHLPSVRHWCGESDCLALWDKNWQRVS